MPLKMNFRDVECYDPFFNMQKLPSRWGKPRASSSLLFRLPILPLPCQCQHIILATQRHESRTNMTLPYDQSYIWKQFRRSSSVNRQQQISPHCNHLCDRRWLPNGILNCVQEHLLCQWVSSCTTISALTTGALLIQQLRAAVLMFSHLYLWMSCCNGF